MEKKILKESLEFIKNREIININYLKELIERDCLFIEDQTINPTFRSNTVSDLSKRVAKIVKIDIDNLGKPIEVEFLSEWHKQAYFNCNLNIKGFYDEKYIQITGFYFTNKGEK